MRKRIFHLDCGATVTNAVTEEMRLKCIQNMRELDAEECSLIDAPVFANERQAAVFFAGGSLVGIWDSQKADNLPPRARAWGWLTTRSVLKNRLAFCKNAQAVVRVWWELEDPGVEHAFMCVMKKYRQAEEYLKRFVGEDLVQYIGDVDIEGHKHSLWRFDRPKKEE